MEKQPNSRYCLLCGRENPLSLKMSWYNNREAKQIWSKVSVPEEFNGYPGIVHGGIVAALLDETAGRAVLLDGDIERLMVTASLNVKYRRPTPTNTEITVIGWVERESGNRARVAGKIMLDDGTVTAECEALVIRPPAEYMKNFNWSPDIAEWFVD